MNRNWWRSFRLKLYVAEFEINPGSEKLIIKIKDLNKIVTDKVDISIVEKAIYYAKKYHGNQKRDSGDPYYTHPIAVAFMVSDYIFRTDILVTSLLHDCIEDTELTKQMISDIFGKVIANQVDDLTRIKLDKKISAAETLDLLYSQNKKDILLVKLFDRLHNMLTLGAKSPDKIKKIVEETTSTFITLAAYLGIREVEEKLLQLCIQYIKQGLIYKNSELPFGSDQDLISLVFQNDEFHI